LGSPVETVDLSKNFSWISPHNADWKFYGGDLHYATHYDGGDGLDAYATEDGMDPFSEEPVHHRVV
jgi:hypothetical protein